MNTELDIKRIQSLTDAIFAVAMTILILEVRIPAGLSGADLLHYFSSHSLLDLFIYVIGFITLGVFWVGSHFHHHHLQKTDRVSSWINILFLMFICAIPFSISFIRSYRHEKISIIFFCCNLIIADCLNYAMLIYAWKKHYIQPDYTRDNLNLSIRRILIPIGIYGSAIAISFISTNLALLLFLAPPIMHMLPEKVDKKVTAGLK